MNEMDELSRFRDAVPAGNTARAEQLFRAALEEGQDPERPVARRRRNLLTRAWPQWRLVVALPAIAVLVTGIVVAVRPSGPEVLTAQLLADRASSAALARPAVNPGQWVYREYRWSTPGAPQGRRGIQTWASWETADGIATYGPVHQAGPGGPLSYSRLGSLPADPAALDAYLERVEGDPNAAPDIRAVSAFRLMNGMLANYVLPPALEAELYQALALLPGIEVDGHVTTIGGQAGVAFVMPPTPQSVELEIILNPRDYAFLAQAAGKDGSGYEMAVVRMVLVGGPGSTRPGVTPPTAAELLAEQVDAALPFIDSQTWPLGGYQSMGGTGFDAGTWIVRELATPSGTQTIWATADDSEQASYADGKLRVCSRSASCARATRWLMPAGPGYALINGPEGRPDPKHPAPQLPESLPQLLAKLNSYSTGCTDVAGDCNAVNVIANMATGYVSNQGLESSWFLLLAQVPGVTVRHLTDRAGQADVAFRFPFTNGVTEILLNASTYQAVGYVRDGAETVMTREAVVTRPGSLTTPCAQGSPRCAS